MQDQTSEPARKTPTEVARACLDAHRTQDWDRLRTLLHPRARIGTFVGGGRPEDPEQAIRRLRAAHADVVYHAEVTGMLELDDRAVLLDGHVRSRKDQGWAQVERCWLYVVREGLLYRSAVHLSRHHARVEYETRGETLAVAD